MNDLFVMNMKRKILFVCLSFLALLQGWAQHTWQAGPVNLELIQRGNSEFPSGFSAFSLKDHLFGVVRLFRQRKMESIIYFIPLWNQDRSTLDL